MPLSPLPPANVSTKLVFSIHNHLSISHEHIQLSSLTEESDRFKINHGKKPRKENFEKHRKRGVMFSGGVTAVVI